MSDELLASLREDAEALPITYETIKRLNAEEPYRLKLSFVRVRLQRTRDRLASYRTGSEGRISHLKRGYGLKRSRLKGNPGTRTWVGWGALAYNLDTYAHYAVRDA